MAQDVSKIRFYVGFMALVTLLGVIGAFMVANQAGT
jgi:hypothetical protein